MEDQRLPQRKVVFIVNPISGTHHKKGRCGEIEKYIRKDLFRFKLFETERPGHATELVKAAIDEGADTVVAVGGDGTVNEVAAALAGSEVKLGIIPTGSGNGLARHLKIPVSIRKALRIIEEGKTTRIDTATVNGRPFVNIAGVGFDAYVARRFAGSAKRRAT